MSFDVQLTLYLVLNTTDQDFVVLDGQFVKCIRYKFSFPLDSLSIAESL